MTEPRRYDGWMICAGCGRTIVVDMVEDDILCPQCAAQLQRCDVCWQPAATEEP